MNREMIISFCDPMSLRSFAVGDVLNSGEIVTRIEPGHCRMYVRRATLYRRAVAKVKSAVLNAWWRIRCAYYDLKDRF
jgi:hypothetical protein